MKLKGTALGGAPPQLHNFRNKFHENRSISWFKFWKAARNHARCVPQNDLTSMFSETLICWNEEKLLLCWNSTPWSVRGKGGGVWRWRSFTQSGLQKQYFHLPSIYSLVRNLLFPLDRKLSGTHSQCNFGGTQRQYNFNEKEKNSLSLPGIKQGSSNSQPATSDYRRRVTSSA